MSGSLVHRLFPAVRAADFVHTEAIAVLYVNGFFSQALCAEEKNMISITFTVGVRRACWQHATEPQRLAVPGQWRLTFTTGKLWAAHHDTALRRALTEAHMA